MQQGRCHTKGTTCTNINGFDLIRKIQRIQRLAWTISTGFNASSSGEDDRTNATTLAPISVNSVAMLIQFHDSHPSLQQQPSCPLTMMDRTQYLYPNNVHSFPPWLIRQCELTRFTRHTQTCCQRRKCLWSNRWDCGGLGCNRSKSKAFHNNDRHRPSDTLNKRMEGTIIMKNQSWIFRSLLFLLVPF